MWTTSNNKKDGKHKPAICYRKESWCAMMISNKIDFKINTLLEIKISSRQDVIINTYLNEPNK